MMDYVLQPYETKKHMAVPSEVPTVSSKCSETLVD